MLMMAYGFCLPDNVYDSYGMRQTRLDTHARTHAHTHARSFTDWCCVIVGAHAACWQADHRRVRSAVAQSFCN
jgi:hypothetical protein